jgi:hypothetical protein
MDLRVGVRRLRAPPDKCRLELPKLWAAPKLT